MSSPASSSVSATSVVEVADRREFAALAPEWNALVASTNDHALYRHEFIQTWLTHFAPAATPRIITLRDEQGRLVAALPLIEERSSMYGLPVRRLASTSNEHSNRFDLVAQDAPAAARSIVRHLAQSPDWDVLRLVELPDTGGAMHIAEAARDAGLPLGIWSSQRSPYLPLCGSLDVVERRLTPKFRSNLRRRRKRLGEHGKIALRRVTEAIDIEPMLAAGLALEESGWKGVEGTAIAQDDRTRGFYAELAREACRLGCLSLYALEVDGRMVAFQYGLTYGGAYLLLKVAYDESLAACSPGHLLVEDVLQDCIGRGLREFDFLGPDMPWKREWTDLVRPHAWLFVFRRGMRGRVLAAAKFKVVPAARRVAVPAAKRLMDMPVVERLMAAPAARRLADRWRG